MDQTATAPRVDADANPDPLVARLRAGDRAAYAEMVRTHGGRMLAVARGIVGEGDAADCVQDAFLQAFRKIDTFEGQAALGTWLHRIVVNAALMRRRKMMARPELSLDELAPVFDDTGCRVEPTYTLLDEPDLAERTEVRAAIIDGLAQLPDEARQIILLRDVEGLSTDQAATELGVSVSAAKVRLHRARAALKRLLEPAFGADSVAEIGAEA